MDFIKKGGQLPHGYTWIADSSDDDCPEGDCDESKQAKHGPGEELLVLGASQVKWIRGAVVGGIGAFIGAMLISHDAGKGSDLGGKPYSNLMASLTQEQEHRLNELLNKRAREGQLTGQDKREFDELYGILLDNVLPTPLSNIHHIASNKHKTIYTPQFKKIADYYGLSLNGDWNKVMISKQYHNSTHPVTYHQFVLDGMKRAQNLAKRDRNRFLQLFQEYVTIPLLKNPKMIQHKK